MNNRIEFDGDIVERYNVAEAEIIIVEKGKEIKYFAREPKIMEKEIETVTTVIEGAYSRKDISYKLGEKILGEEFSKLPKSTQYYAQKMVSAYSRLYPIVLDPNVLEIDIISSSKPVYIRHRHFLKLPFIETNIRFESRRDYEQVIEKIKNKITKYSSENPYEGPIDNVFYAQIISQKDPCENLCFLRRRLELPSTATWVIEEKILSPQEFAYIWTLIEIKITIGITGATREDRRLLLNGLVTMIPQKAKIVAVEKTPVADVLHEYFVTISVNKENNLDFKKAFDIAQRQNMEYLIVDGDDIENEIRLPSTKICFIYSKQTPMEIQNGAQSCLILPNSPSQGRLEYIEEMLGERLNITFNRTDAPKQVFERSKILQSWAKENHISREKVIESLTLKTNLVMYVNGTEL